MRTILVVPMPVMKPTIYLALTHDCELRGDGSGDIETILFAPMRRLLEIYAKYGVQTSFTPDLLQQLTFRSLGLRNPELNSLAEIWDEHMLQAFRKGHDIQLHLHPQWQDAKYRGGKWFLRSSWSLLDYPPEATFRMVKEGKQYLEDLLQQVDPTYRCHAFRAAALAIAPSPYMLDMLSTLGIGLDVSIAPGLYVDTQHVNVDYRTCEETLLPYYPQMDDARKLSEVAQGIVCVPIHCFYGSRGQTLKEHLEKLWRAVNQRVAPQHGAHQQSIAAYGKREWRQRNHSSTFRLLYDKVVLPYVTGKYLVADTGRLSFSYSLLCEMLTSARNRAMVSGEKEVPVVITNHLKEIRSFKSLERFIREASQADDVRFITLTELARKLRADELPIKMRVRPVA